MNYSRQIDLESNALPPKYGSVDLVIRPRTSTAKKKKSRFSADRAPLVMVFDRREWPLRSLIHKNIHHETVARRMLTYDEAVIIQKRWRLGFHVYHTWNGLIEDETRIAGADHPFVLKLHELAKSDDFKWIAQHKIGKQTDLFPNLTF